MASHEDDDFVYSKDHWSEDEEDRRLLDGDETGNKNRDRSPLRGSSGRIRSEVGVPSSAIARQIDEALDAKLEGFLSRVQSAVANNGEAGLEDKFASLQLQQKDLLRQQRASDMKTEGGKNQVLALSSIKAKLEEAELGISIALSKPERRVKALADTNKALDEAKAEIDRRIALVTKADSTQNGFQILSKYEKAEKVGKGALDSKVDKLWGEASKAVEKEKSEREKRSRGYGMKDRGFARKKG